jgi:hypothetical protein
MLTSRSSHDSCLEDGGCFHDCHHASSDATPPPPCFKTRPQPHRNEVKANLRQSVIFYANTVLFLKPQPYSHCPFEPPLEYNRVCGLQPSESILFSAIACLSVPTPTSILNTLWPAKSYSNLSVGLATNLRLSFMFSYGNKTLEPMEARLIVINLTRLADLRCLSKLSLLN